MDIRQARKQKKDNCGGNGKLYKMKLCHITTVHQNRYDVRIFQKECTSLAKAGYDVTLLVNDELPDEIKDDVKIMSVAVSCRNRLNRILKASKAVYKKALELDADIYHLHDPELLQIAVKLKKHGKKVVFDSHEFSAVQIRYKPYIPAPLRIPISNIYRKYEARCLGKLDGMVEPCTYNGEDFFEEVRIPKVIIGNYPKADQFEEVSREGADYDRCCYVGSLTEIRGLFHMIRACHLAGKKLVLIGHIEPELRQRMESMPEYECVEYMGVLPHDTAMREAAKCGIGLSILEPAGQYVSVDNLPTKVYEYMMMGMPVILSDFPFFRKTAEKYGFGVTVDSTDDRAVADAIHELADDRDRMRRMGEEGKRAIQEEMNWESDAKKLIDFYGKIGGEKK